MMDRARLFRSSSSASVTGGFPIDTPGRSDAFSNSRRSSYSFLSFFFSTYSS